MSACSREIVEGAAPERLLSPAQVGAAVGVSDVSVRKWIKTGRLRAVKIGVKHYGISRAELARLKAEMAEA
jgi:excisionase family DNA binding protein